MLFQSTPAITDGRRLCFAKHPPRIKGFNPRPPSLTGDAAGRRRAHTDSDSFNPRPPSLTGDAAVAVQVQRLSAVSIHARHH